MTQKRNKKFLFTLIPVVALAIIALATLSSAGVGITSPQGFIQTTPAIVSVDSSTIHGQLAFDCPGCPG
jgi:hypothetical protein